MVGISWKIAVKKDLEIIRPFWLLFPFLGYLKWVLLCFVVWSSSNSGAPLDCRVYDKVNTDRHIENKSRANCHHFQPKLFALKIQRHSISELSIQRRAGTKQPLMDPLYVVEHHWEARPAQIQSNPKRAIKLKQKGGASTPADRPARPAGHRLAQVNRPSFHQGTSKKTLGEATFKVDGAGD